MHQYYSNYVDGRPIVFNVNNNMRIFVEIYGKVFANTT